MNNIKLHKVSDAREGARQREWRQRTIANAKFSRFQLSLIRDLRNKIVSDDEALFIDQRALNGLCRRELIVRTSQGFIVSKLGHEALHEFEHTSAMKDHASANLGRWVSVLKTVRMARAS